MNCREREGRNRNRGNRVKTQARRCFDEGKLEAQQLDEVRRFPHIRKIRTWGTHREAQQEVAFAEFADMNCC